jgi:hypothetical protein
METDGHWPLARKVPELGDRTAICCECGAQPKRVALLPGLLDAWHRVHRAGMRLAPVEYSWPQEMSGLSAGGYAGGYL